MIYPLQPNVNLHTYLLIPQTYGSKIFQYFNKIFPGLLPFLHSKGKNGIHTIHLPPYISQKEYSSVFFQEKNGKIFCK